MDQHLADLLGLDLTDPEVVAALAEIDGITAIRARVWDVLHRTGTTETDLAELINVDPAKIAASLAGDRRFSTYELAAIAEHGGTTVEWLTGEYPHYEYVETPDDAWYRALPIEARAEFEDELAAATNGDRATILAAWRSTGRVYADPELLAALTSDHHCDGGPVPMPEARTWSTLPGVEWALGQLQTDATPPRPEYRYESMMDADAFRQLRLGAWSPPEPPVQLRIDPNRRTQEGHVPVPYNDSERPLKRGTHVIVYEPEDGVATTATVMRVYGDWVHLDVDWDQMIDTGNGATGDGPLRPDVVAELSHRIAGWGQS